MTRSALEQLPSSERITAAFAELQSAFIKLQHVFEQAARAIVDLARAMFRIPSSDEWLKAAYGYAKIRAWRHAWAAIKCSWHMHLQEIGYY